MASTLDGLCTWSPPFLFYLRTLCLGELGREGERGGRVPGKAGREPGQQVAEGSPVLLERERGHRQVV